MKIERCQLKTETRVQNADGSGFSITRQCLGEAGHHQSQKLPLKPHGELEVGKTDHEFAPICTHCGQVMLTQFGDPRNERVSA